MKKQLQNLPMKIDIAETEEADEYDGELWYYPMITESVSYTHLSGTDLYSCIIKGMKSPDKAFY